MLTKAPIKHFANVGSGQGAPQRETDFSETGIPFIRAGSLEDLLNGREENDLPKVNEEIAKEYRLKLYQPNTIVFAKSGMSALKGRIYKLKNPCYVVNHLATLELKENAIPDYVIYTLRYFSPVKLINNNAYPSLKQSVIENYEIPFPKDKEYQLHIANLLSKAENLISQRKESIRLLDEFLKSTFLEMFGDPGINPKNWPIKKLEEYIEYMGDIGSNGSNEMVAKNLEMLDEEDYAIMIRTTNLTRNDFTNNIKYVTQKTYEFFKKSKIYGGEIIMNKIGSAGDFWLMPKLNRPVTLGLNQLVIRPKNLPTLYLFHYLSTDYGRMIVKAQAKGATTKSITKTAVKALPLMYPPVELQNKFVSIVEKTEALKTQYQQSLQELEKLYGSLSQKAFRGELVSKKREAKVVTLTPETKLVQPELNKQQAFLRKLMLASHIIYELCDEPTFGHTKLMKLLYLTEQAGGMALQTSYKKFAAGPFDGKTLTLIDKEFAKNKWFAIDKKSFTIGGQKREATVYKKTEKSLLYKKHFDNYFESESETINRIIALLRKEQTQTAEIVATLYFAWKELIAANSMISEDSLVKGFYQFHKEKRKFTREQVLLGYEYMQTNELYPQSVL